MRLIITLIASFILLLPAGSQGRWKIVEVEIDSVQIGESMYLTDNLFDVQFINRDNGIFCGGINIYVHTYFRILYKTVDGGKTWNLIYEDDSNNFSSICFVNESKVFLAENWQCRVLTSSDGGNSWAEDTILGSVQGIFFLNDSAGWAFAAHFLADDFVIIKTINGGDSWNKVYKNESQSYSNIIYNSLFFIDDESGWAVGEAESESKSVGLITKYNLNDGWEEIHADTDLPLNKVFFIDRNNGWIAGGYSSRIVNTPTPLFMRTVDGGETWTKTAGLNYLINDFYFDNKDHGWAVGEDKAERGVILETVNGGVDWEVVKDSLSARLNALHIADGIGWAVGDEGLILTDDSTVTGIILANKTNSDNESLLQNYPNPFQSNTIITYQLPTTGYVELSIYDLSGRKVATLVNEVKQADRYEMEWNTGGMQPGIYFCELKTGQGRQVMKMSIVR